jgi:hypothetical protein
LFLILNFFFNEPLNFLKKAYTQAEIKAIVTERTESAAIKIAQIENNTKFQIEALKVKYAIPDAIKTTSGFIAIGTLGSLVSLLIINECINLFKYMLNKEDRFDVKNTKNNKKPIAKPIYVPRQK